METQAQNTLTRDRTHIHAFVIEFYGEVRKHDILGPIFNDKIGDHWPEHFETLTNFWMNVLFGERAYKGNPFSVHQQVTALKSEHFDMWLSIFHPVAKQMLDPDLADIASHKAERIAQSLRQGLFFKL